jgi:hypothetical protein
VAKRLSEIQEFHPEVEVEQCSIQVDHVHLVVVIKTVYWRNEFVGFFSSTVGIDEAVIKRYVEFQEKVDKGQLKLQLDFGF